jgi:hypothetical protein
MGDDLRAMVDEFPLLAGLTDRERGIYTQVVNAAYIRGQLHGAEKYANKLSEAFGSALSVQAAKDE